MDLKSDLKSLDLTLLPGVQPRYKTWLPLASQQLRLRSLIQIIGFQLNTLNSQNSCWFYFTLHRSSMSSPLYTSELLDTVNPKWASFEQSTLYVTGYSAASEIIIRVWQRTEKDNSKSDVTVFTWGIAFSGLGYIGPKLPSNLETIVRENSLIFHLNGGYFTPSFCFLLVPEPKRFLSMTISALDVRDSYTVGKLSTLQNQMQTWKQKTDAVRNLKEKIASGENLIPPKYPQTTLNRLLQPKRGNKEKKAQILSIKKDLEVAKFRTKLLEQERVRKMSEIRSLSLSHSDLVGKNEEYKCALVDKYKELNLEMENLNEQRRNYILTRESFIQTTTRLAHRQRQLISELSYIYPITLISRETEGNYAIHDVHLPDSEKLDTCNDTKVAVALGFVAHTTQMIANFLNVPTRYPIIHYGSRSKIVDHINTNLPDHERQFPLFARSKDKLQFHYAVYLLNKNIAQLRWYCGLSTTDLRATLANVSGLINIKPLHSLDSPKRTISTSSLDIDTANRSNFTLTPPTQQALFDKYYRNHTSMSEFKGMKTQLGSSLDQGLNQPLIQSRHLNAYPKRICKSEESAIDDDGTLSVPVCSVSSDETFNENLFNQSKIASNMYRHLGNTYNEQLFQNEIEILVPMSVSEPKNNFDSVCARQRSSNSISSCEIALCSSMIDGNDNNCDSNFLTEELETKNDSIQGIEKNFSNQASTESLKSKSQKSNVENELCSRVIVNPCIDKQSYTNSTNAVEEIGTDKLSSDVIIPCGQTITTESLDSIDNPDITTDHPNDSRQNQTLSLSVPQTAPKYSESMSEIIECKTVCDEKPRKSLMNFSSEVQSEEESNDITSSSEYLDSIRRSSESVYARTEALANKTTSFKVMRPRL